MSRKGTQFGAQPFRCIGEVSGYPVGIAADVERAFHQIVIHPDDRRMLRFLWFNDPFKEHPEIAQFQFCPGVRTDAKSSYFVISNTTPSPCSKIPST